MGYAFVSYSRRESAAADLIIDRLTRSGIAVWRDTSSMPAGVAWKRQVSDAIRGADLVVMCVSPLWNGSRACRDEEDWARYYHRPQVRVSVDPREFNLGRAITIINAAWAAVTPEDRLVGELEAAAGDWANTGGGTRGLARGRALKTYRRMFGGTRSASRPGARGADPTERLTPVAVRYLRQSSHHRIVMRILAMLAVVAIVCAGVAGVTFATRMRQIEQADATWSTGAKQWNRLRTAMLDNPYEAMETILDDPHDAATMRSADYVIRMRMVLGMHVPDDHGGISEERFARYIFPDHMTTKAPAGLPAMDVKIRGYAVSPDELYVAALADDGVHILDPTRAVTLMTLVGADLTDAESMAWSQDGSALAVRSSAGMVSVWKVRERAAIVARTGSWFMSGTAMGGESDGPTGGGPYAALLARDGRITVVDTTKSRVVSDDTRVPVDAGVSIEADPDDANVAYVTGTNQGKTVLYRVAWAGGIEAAGAGTTTRIAVPGGCTTNGLAVLPGGRQIALGCGTRVDILDVANGKRVRSITDDSGPTVSVIRADGRGRLFVGFDGGNLAVVESGADAFIRPDVDSLQSGGVGLCLNGTARAVAVSGNKALFVGDGTVAQSCSRDVSQTTNGNTRAGGSWAIHVGMVDFTDLSDAHQARAVAASPDGTSFAAGLSDGSVSFSRHDMQPGPLVREVPGEVRAVVYSSDGGKVVAATRDGLVYSVSAPESGEYEGATLRKQVQRRLDRAVKLGLYRRR